MRTRCFGVVSSPLPLRPIWIRRLLVSLWWVAMSVCLLGDVLIRPNQLSAAEPERKGNTIRLPVTRDLWVSTVGAEANGNN
ncbi:MAG: hypothetical protein ACKPEY_09240, partial [Planctomycetota bacterium]